MLNRASNVKVDAVGKIDIGDKVFIGYGAIVLPNVTISSNAIVGAGAVVTKDVAEGDIVAGVPARPVASKTRVKKLQAQTQRLPWVYLINRREGCFDHAIEPQLVQLRVSHFYSHIPTSTVARSEAWPQPTFNK
jgi:acyl-[acyl carrier protein]--UDP-N-acetylglucosamine O-acyltransferase